MPCKHMCAQFGLMNVYIVPSLFNCMFMEIALHYGLFFFRGAGGGGGYRVLALAFSVF